MKKVLPLLLMFSMFSASGQYIPSYCYRYFVKYYPFDEGIQMVEVGFGLDFDCYVANTKYEKELQDGLSRLPPPVPPNQLYYIFRDTDGTVLKSFSFYPNLPKDKYPLKKTGDLTEKDIQNDETDRYVIMENSLYGLIDRKGNIIIVPKYNDLIVSGDFLFALEGSKYGLLDKTGKVVAPFIFDQIKTGGRKDIFVVTKMKKYSYLNGNGETIINKEYECADGFYGDRAAVGNNGKFGFIDMNGNEIIPLQYDGAFEFHENTAIVKKGNKYGLIDKSGKAVTGFEYDELNFFFEKKKHTGELIFAGYVGSKGKEKYYFDLQGKPVDKKK